MKKLAIMRHGHAENYVTSDRERRLTDRGVLASGQGASVVGRFFDSDFPLAHVYHSPFVRTTHTASTLLASFSEQGRALMGDVVSEPSDELLGEQSPKQVLTWLVAEQIDNALFVSHQPLVSQLLAYLIDADSSSSAGARYPMAPASIALLEYETQASGCFELIKLHHV
jgi:phosphohistidine phosphatase